MNAMFGLEPLGRLLPLLAAAVSLGACSGQPTKDPRVLGYGTPGVSSYVQDDQAASLQAQLERCDQVSLADAASETQGLAAACGQLKRMLRNQPGNTVQPGRAR